jgi:uncharacterized protein (TIGR00369 family)
MANLESMRAWLEASKEPPIARTLGFHLVSMERDHAVFELAADLTRHANPMGTLHGGVLCDLADAAMGYSWATGLEDGETFTTLELKINFFKPVFRGTLRAEGRVVRRGRTVGYVEADVTDEKGALVAKAASTCMTLRGDQAKGR